jgi:hypothetical protein
LFFWGGTQLNRGVRQTPLEAGGFFSYVIPKLKAFIPNISLMNRTFADHRKLLAKTEMGKQSHQEQKPTPTPTPTATAQPTPVAKAKARVVNPELRVNVVGGDTDPSSPSDSDLFNQEPANHAPIGPIDSPTTDAQIGEWKMKIYRSPTKETMNDLIFEYQSGKMQKTVFYQLLEELMRDANPDIQRLAVYALAATPSYDSLVALLNNKDQLDSEAHDMIKVAYDSYSKPDRLKILEAALKSDSHIIILGALPLAIKAAQKITLWTADYSSTSSGRERRSPSRQVPKEELKGLIAALQALERSSDTQIAQAALEALNQLGHRLTTASRGE